MHWDYVFQKSKTHDIGEFRRRFNRVRVLVVFCLPRVAYLAVAVVVLLQEFPENFEACLCVYCEPSAFSPSFGSFNEQLSLDYVYGAFGGMLGVMYSSSTSALNAALQYTHTMPSITTASWRRG